MRTLLVAAPIVAFGCRGPSGPPAAYRADDAPPVSISITLDRATIAATDELTGTMHVEFRAPPRDSSEVAKAWCAIKNWRLELANETAPLLDLVVEGEDEMAAGYAVPIAKRNWDCRFKVVPCAALAERSRASAVPLRLIDPGNHALRLVLDARGPGLWSMAGMIGPNGEPLVPLDGSFTSRWCTFDVTEAGKSIDRNDVSALLQEVDEWSAASVLVGFVRRGTLSKEECIRAATRAVGTRRGRLLEGIEAALGLGTILGTSELRSLFADVEGDRVELPTHPREPFFLRVARRRAIAFHRSGPDLCPLQIDAIEPWDEHSGTAMTSADGRSRWSAQVPGLFRATCFSHVPSMGGWILVE